MKYNVCIIAEGDKVHRKCGREGENEAKCVNDGGFCTCKVRGGITNTVKRRNIPSSLGYFKFFEKQGCGHPPSDKILAFLN